MTKLPEKQILAWESLLIIAVFLCAFVIPVFPPDWGKTPLRIGFTMIFVSGVMIRGGGKSYFVYLALTAFMMEWISGILSWEIIAIVSKTLNSIFFLIVIFSLFHKMATAKVVTAKVIMSSISGYLLLGILYSLLIAAIVQWDADAFNFAKGVNNHGDPATNLSNALYFGFVTLATVGYGDIVPLKPYTRSLATLISISGQLYIATIIGILIGKYASGNSPAEK
jgi:voltage-gated potassium channel